MGLRFWKNMAKNKVAEAGRGLQDAIIAFDPEVATEAAIGEMEDNFDGINREFSKVKQEWQREESEAVAIQATYDQRLAAAEHLSAQVEAGGTGSKKAEEGLNQLLVALEGMAEDVEIERQEAEDAKLLMDDLQETVDMYASKLKTARRDMKKAANSMARAKVQEDRAEKTAQRAAQAAGLRSNAGGLSSALESMQRQADDATANADAAKRKAALLGPTKAEDNDAVAAAMAAVSGEEAAPTSAVDRLAALRK